MFAKEGIVNARRYGMKDILRRRIQYMEAVLFKKDMYDHEQQSLVEYGRCLAQRKGRRIAGTEYFRRKLSVARRKNKLIISRIAVSVTNQCSLKCRDCNNLMPYCKEGFVIEAEEQIRDLKKLFDYVDGIVNVELIGGEPFTYRQLPKVLEYLCAESKVKFIEITSNGTILPSDEIIELLGNPKVCVLLSDYGKVNAEKAERAYKYLEEHQICVIKLVDRKWIYSGNIERRKKKKRQIKYEYFHCHARKDCRTLYKGRLYVCGRAPILDELGLLTDESSFINIRELSSDRLKGRQQIKRFFQNDYAESCAYCDYSADDSCWIEPGTQI